MNIFAKDTVKDNTNFVQYYAEKKLFISSNF